MLKGINGEIAGTLDSSYYKGCGERHGIEREVVYAENPVIAFKQGNGAKARSIGAHEECSPTLSAAESGTNRTPCVSVCVGNGQLNQISMAEQSNTLDTMHDQQCVMVSDVACFQNTGQGWWNQSDVGATVRTPCGGDSVKANLIKEDNGVQTRGGGAVKSVVRRLTPLE